MCVSKLEKKQVTWEWEGDSGVIPGSPMLFAGEGLAIVSIKRRRYWCHT